MEIKHTRIDWIDTGKFICIMFVMLSHLESGAAALDRFYTPFFLPMFFFLSGYVYKQPASFGAHMKKKTLTLLLPWLIFSVGNILLTYVTPFVEKEGVWKRFVWCFLQIRGLQDETWFVSALFMAFIPFYFFARWKKPLWSGLLAFVLSVASLGYCYLMPGEIFPWGVNALPWHLEYVFQAMIWMLLGYYFKLYGNAFFDKHNTRLNRVLLWAAYLFMVYCPGFGLPGVGGIVLSHVVSAVGILALMSICKVIKSNGYIRFVGANTLTYFALHGRVYAAVELGLKLAAGGFYAACLSRPWASGLLAVAITFVVSLILMIPAEIINRWFPWVLGRKREKNAV